MKEISEEKEGVKSSLNLKSANQLGNRVHGGGGGGGVLLLSPYFKRLRSPEIDSKE
jgi:hypothetical protein